MKARRRRTVTTITLEPATHRWLRDAAQELANRDGGRPSVSRVLELLTHRAARVGIELALEQK
jgi:hypothetical protein